MNSNFTSGILQFLLALLFGLLLVMIFFGTVIYLIDYVGSLVDLKQVSPPFELAVVSTALGGFLLSAARRRWSRHVDPSITASSRLFLGAAVSFSAVYVLLFLIKSMTGHLNWVDWLAIGFTDFLLVVAASAFAVGLVVLSYAILFWNHGNNKDKR
jgi:hypothetical protein